jgi:hypothetical protein
MKHHLIVTLLLAALPNGGGQTLAADQNSLDAIARDYVLLSLTIGEKEEGYIDAYYGPPELQAKAKADAAGEDLAELAKRATTLSERVAKVTSDAEGMDLRRAKFLARQLTAVSTRLRMLRGEKLSFEDEAEGLFGLRPRLEPLASYEPTLRKIEALVPGRGPLNQRVEAFQAKLTIPSDKLRLVLDAAIAECRARTIRHIQLPQSENFELALVAGKNWSAYNYYKGNFRSRIEVNTDLPIHVSRAVEFGCHEGYPGHHVFNVLIEQRLTEGRKWIEFSVYPLYSQQSLLVEGTAEYGIDLAFPAKERLTFEVGKLFPLAGLSPDNAERYFELQNAISKLRGARLTIARDLIDGTINDADAVRLTQHYLLVSPGMARRLTDQTKQYRSYLINEGLGVDMVRADVEAAGPLPAARWARMEQLLSEPTLSGDLRRSAVTE